ncbi:hypothetical protein AgCh_007205 [Apium graveolens]
MNMKKRATHSSSASISPLRRLRIGSRFFIAILVLLCLCSMFGFHHFTNHIQGTPKIAFMFLVRENLPLDFLWHSFFKNADAAKFSIYIHSKPGFVFDESTTVSEFFYNRQLSMCIQVGWGKPSMIEAERLLLEEALADSDNQRFVLLSDSCVPLHNFSYVYNYLISSPRSYVESFVDQNETRYSTKMFPIIPEEKWRKGSQWISLVRRHAELIVQDYTVFPVFKKFCKRRPPLDIVKAKLENASLVQTEHNCIPDEHYVQTLFMLKALKDEIFRRSLTYSLWNHSTNQTDTTGWHPVTFNYENAEQQYIEKIKDIKNIFYESEHRTERCYSNSIDTPCYLFARKFTPGAALRLLTDGVVGPYDPTVMLKPRRK